MKMLEKMHVPYRRLYSDGQLDCIGKNIIQKNNQSRITFKTYILEKNKFRVDLQKSFLRQVKLMQILVQYLAL